MSYKIAIASGKGGTGKTTLATNLFQYFKNNTTKSIQLVDCDVEEPNDILFFSNAKKIKEEQVFKLVPDIDTQKCTFCNKCAEYCEFNAIVIIPSLSFTEVNASLCHSCGACSYACEDNAITEKKEAIGYVNHYRIEKASIMEGRLKIGSAMQTMLIKETKKKISRKADIIIFDAPPGTSCPVVETITDTDFLILVTEPTPFGFHDLKLMIALLKEIDIPYGVVINKSGLGDQKIQHYLKKEHIELIAEIPFARDFSALYAQGKIKDNLPKEIARSYALIHHYLQQKIKYN